MNGLVALITGGAAGLGFACVKRFARQGVRVIICDLPSSKGNEIVEKWSSTFATTKTSETDESSSSNEQESQNQTDQTNVKNSSANYLSTDQTMKLERPKFFPADVTNEEQIQSMFEKIRQQYTRLDVVINCAGIGKALRTYNVNKRSVHSLEEFRRLLDVNLTGTFNVVRWGCHIMADNKPDAYGQRGVIINTSSIAAYDGQIGQVAYAASKGAIASMTLPLARDLSTMGVRVCTIAPGVFQTPMLAALPEKVRTLLGNMVPFPPRLGQSDDFARLAQTIIENPYLNGEVIRLDGALRMPP